MPTVKEMKIEPRQILVVDDEPNMRKVMKAMLMQDGYDVQDAGDGELIGIVALVVVFGLIYGVWDSNFRPVGNVWNGIVDYDELEAENRQLREELQSRRAEDVANQNAATLLEEVLAERCLELGIPAITGLMIGHIDDFTTVPIGCGFGSSAALTGALAAGLAVPALASMMSLASNPEAPSVS